MKPTDFIKEEHNLVQAATEMHTDHEIQMAREACYRSASNAIELHRMLKHISEQEGLQAWASEKISLANDYLRAVKEWLEYELMSRLEGRVAENNMDIVEGTKETSTGRVHKSEPGGYGRRDDEDEDKKKAKPAEPAVKRGRGRPKKDADSDTGEVKKWDTAALSGVFGGSVPKKLPGKASVKHKIKDEPDEKLDENDSQAQLRRDFDDVIQKVKREWEAKRARERQGMSPRNVSEPSRAELEARLRELESEFDPEYQYSDDYSFWTKQNAIAREIASIKKKLGSQGVAEAKSLKKRVRVVQGEHSGKTGWIREIKYGIHSTSPKRYYVDIDGGGQANNLPASALRLLKNQSDGEQGVAEGSLGEADASAVQFRTASTDNYQSSFTVTAIADGKNVGHFSFFRDPETDDVHNQAEVTDDVRGKGYGKALLLKAIEVANDHGLGFQEDSQSLSRAQSRVYDSLYDAGWIVDADGYWFLTPKGEQELARLSIIQQGVAEGLSKQFEIIYLDQSGERKRKIVSGTSKEAVARQFKKQYKLEIEQVKQLQQGVAEGLDPDTQRLEQEVRDALANGDDYTAKSLVKMAQTAADRNYLRKIIRQEMYGTGPGQGGVAEGQGSIVDKCASLAAKYFNSAGLQQQYDIDEFIKINTGDNVVVDKCASLAAKYFNSAGLQQQYDIGEYIKANVRQGVAEGWRDEMPSDMMSGTMDKIRTDINRRRYQYLQNLLKKSKKPETIAQIKALLAKEFPQGVAEGSDNSVEALIQVYNNRDQKIVKTKVFRSEDEANRWADRNNATILKLKDVAKKSTIDETTAGSIAGVVNPKIKNKSKVGTLFGGTYRQQKDK